MGTRGGLCWALAAVITIAVAPAAGADTFCVDREGCVPGPTHNFTTIQQAVDAADANDPPSPEPASRDNILVGAGVFHGAVDNGFDNPVDIVGSGPRTATGGTLIERDPGNNVRTVAMSTSFGSVAASTIRDVTIHVPPGTNNTGLQSAGDAENVTVTAESALSSGVGISVNGNGPTTVRNAEVDLPGTAVGVRLHLANLKGSSVKASTGLQGDGTVHGSTIDANLGAQSSGLKLEDCVMRISGADGIALSAVGIGVNVFNRVTARHVTVIGDSDPTSLAVRAEAEGTASSDNSADVDIRSSILRGFAKNFKRSATNAGGHTGTANITVAYSNYDSSIPVDDNGGPGSFNETTPGGNTSADPGFRSATDLHLSAGSALIDAGDPASPSVSDFPPDSTVDFDGLPRKVDGDRDGVARADIGAFEIQDTTAPTIILKGRKIQRGAKLVRVKVTSDEAADVVGKGHVRVPAVTARSSSAGATKTKRFKLRGQTKPIAAGETTTLGLGLKKVAKRRTKRAQAEGKTARVRVTVRVTDAAGNEASAKRKVKLKAKKR